MRLVDPSYRWYSSFRNSSTCGTVVSLSTSGVPYAHVCGQLMAYTDISVQNYSGWCRVPPFNPQASVDYSYVAGFSITHGRPRQHIWSLASNFEEVDWCPGFDGSENPPEFVGKNNFMGSCESNYLECDFENRFIVNLTEPVSDNIEIRACSGSVNFCICSHVYLVNIFFVNTC